MEESTLEDKKFCQCGCGEQIVKCRRHFARFITGHNTRLRTPKQHWNWKGGISRNSSGGYIEIKKPDHPFATSRGYVRKHRLVWEEHNKAILLPYAVVHHINENRIDNRIENLEAICFNSKHMRQFHRGDMSSRVCSYCNSNHTLAKLIREDYVHYYWYRNPNDKSKWLCNTCIQRYKRRFKTSLEGG